MDSLYTIIVDYAGGTYISQVRAPDETEALKQWCVTFIAEQDVPENVRPIADKVLSDLHLFRPVALEGLTSAWHGSTVSYRRRLGSINIVRTAED